MTGVADRSATGLVLGRYQTEFYDGDPTTLRRYSQAGVAAKRVSARAHRHADGADANFYLHEISESTMMGRGMSYDAAHTAALEKYGASPFSLYHPQVIQQFAGEFNSAWRAFWGL